MSDQPWNRVRRTGSVMDVDSSQPRPQVTFALPPEPLPSSQSGDTASRKRRRVLSPESSEETVGDQRNIDHNPGPTQDPRWAGPSRPPSVASSYDSSTEADLHRLAIMGPSAAGEYYETWPDPEDGDEPGFTQPAAQDPPTPTQAEIPLPVGGGGGQSGALAVQVSSSRKRITKEDTLMCIDPSQPQEDSASRCTSADDALTAKLAAMFDQMRQKQLEDTQIFAESIKAQLVVEFADLKNEMTRLRAELVDMRIQYHRMQNGQ